MSKLFPAITFAVGAAVGSAVAWYFAKTKYERIAQDEIDSVKQAFVSVFDWNSADKDGDEVETSETRTAPEEKAALAKEKPAIETVYKSVLNREGYVNYSDVNKATDEKDHADQPYLIDPDNVEEFDDYMHIDLTYYVNNDILADDLDEIVDDPDNVVGTEFKGNFGLYESEMAFVRNDRLKADYEIYYDPRDYYEVIGEKSHKG
jgi:hypothetical protein